VTDAAAFAAAFSGALAARGADPGTLRAIAFAETLSTAETRSLVDLYWIARIAMLATLDDLDAFHAAFIDVVNRFTDADALAALIERVDVPPNERPTKRETRQRPPPPDTERADERLDEAVPFLAMASDDEQLAVRDFAEMDESERGRALAAMARLRVAVELRRVRRRRLAARGDRLDMRATMRHAARTAGDLLRRRASVRREKPRSLVFICDVSGSMAPYARALLQYARVAALARPRVRAFAFATRLTEITALARHASDEDAMGAFAATLRDYGGGTRIAASLHDFNDRFAQRGAARGGTVVILSDGWEREDPAGVGKEMARLRRLSRRIVWVNPQKKHPAFEPLAGGMAAALPHVDAFVTGHNLRSLDAIADAIENVVLA
jgi:uncharacterized protein with von Willebrand factor type A (vWA) domain